MYQSIPTGTKFLSKVHRAYGTQRGDRVLISKASMMRLAIRRVLKRSQAISATALHLLRGMKLAQWPLSLLPTDRLCIHEGKCSTYRSGISIIEGILW